MEGKMQPNEQFKETKTHKSLDKSFDFQVKEVLHKCTNNTQPIACHYYVEIDGQCIAREQDGTTIG
jgi:hypothetical protein